MGLLKVLLSPKHLAINGDIRPIYRLPSILNLFFLYRGTNTNRSRKVCPSDLYSLARQHSRAPPRVSEPARKDPAHNRCCPG